MKNILPIIGAIALGATSCEKESDSVRHATRRSAEAIMENNYQSSEAAVQQKSFVEWSKLEPMDTFVKKNPGKSFEFYYKQAEKIDNDPTASIDDGGEQTQKERILQSMQHDIRAGKYTLQDISMTSSGLEAQIEREKRQVMPLESGVKINEDGDDGYDENNLPAYIRAIDNGLELAEIPRRPSAPTGLRILKSEKPKKPKNPSETPRRPSAPTGLTIK